VPAAQGKFAGDYLSVMPFGLPDQPSPFIGRNEELNALASHLLSEPRSDTAKQALVLGPVGVGKTALVTEFTNRHVTEFPGGIHYMPSFSTEFDAPDDAMRAAEIVADHFEPRSRALVIIEEASQGDPRSVGAFVQTIRRKRPGGQVILTSQIPLVMPEDWLTLSLGGLHNADLKTLLDHPGLGGEDIQMLLSHVNGNPLLGKTLANLALQGEGVEQLLARLGPATYPGLVGPTGRPLDPSGQPSEAVDAGLRAMNIDLLQLLKEDPDRVHALSPRQFEEFVAALYEKHGFEVELTPPSKDGGLDLYAVRYEPYGKVLTIVECKRNAPDRPVGVEIVRSLYGAVEDKGASIGVLATSSSFTAGAKKLQEKHKFRLALQDWFRLQDMLSADPFGGS
jgi:restriction system protein